ncbi:MAG: hypothetical protein ACOZNI_19680 [Myxococcota bacterium]
MLLLLQAAFAAETSVLVSSFQPRNAEATGLAGLVEGFLAQELDKHPDLDVLRVEDTPGFDDYPARTYMEGCPPGDVVGCTLVIAQRGGARFAVTGTVQSLVAGTRVTVDVIDVADTRVVLSFSSELDAGSDEAFAEGVAKVLVAAIGGELAEADIREDGEPEDDGGATNEEVARQLAELSKELGAVTAIVQRTDKPIDRPRYTVEDLAKQLDSDTTPRWERLGMSAEEYLRYKNSGMDLRQWRERAIGRKGAVIVRPWVGYARGPFWGAYYGRYAIDPDSEGGLETPVGTTSAQAVTTGPGGGGGLQVGYGLLPSLDVGVAGGVVGGTYSIDMDQVQVGIPEGDVEPELRQTTTVFFGPRFLVAPLPVRAIRPVFGGGVVFARGKAVGDYYAVSEHLVTWPASWLVMIEGFAGGEARISRQVDVFVHVPLDLLVQGETLVAEESGDTSLFDGDALLPAGAIGFGVQAGVQLRFGGAKPKETTRFDDLEEEPEE